MIYKLNPICNKACPVQLTIFHQENKSYALIETEDICQTNTISHSMINVIKRRTLNICKLNILSYSPLFGWMIVPLLTIVGMDDFPVNDCLAGQLSR